MQFGVRVGDEFAGHGVGAGGYVVEGGRDIGLGERVEDGVGLALAAVFLVDERHDAGESGVEAEVPPTPEIWTSCRWRPIWQSPSTAQMG